MQLSIWRFIHICIPHSSTFYIAVTPDKGPNEQSYQEVTEPAFSNVLMNFKAAFFLIKLQHHHIFVEAINTELPFPTAGANIQL